MNTLISLAFLIAFVLWSWLVLSLAEFSEALVEHKTSITDALSDKGNAGIARQTDTVSNCPGDPSA